MNKIPTKSAEIKELNKGLRCPKCLGLEFWIADGNRLKCKNCRYIFTLKSNPLNISNKILNDIVSEFLLEHSTNIILERINVSKYKLLKVLTLLRILMAKDIPNSFCETIKLDKIYFEKQIENIIKKGCLKNSDLNKEITHPIIGIFSKEGMIYAKILSNIKMEDLKKFLKNQEKKKSINSTESWINHMGLVFKNRLYRLTFLEEKKHRIDTLENFWGYLKRKLSAKGGIRKEKLFLYLGEYTWRYNHKKITFKEQEKLLLNLIKTI